MAARMCTRCHRVKPRTAEFFGPGARMADGMNSWCRDCCRDYARQAARARRATAAPPLRTCCRCGERKPATPEAFGPGARMADGFNSWCRDCVNAYARERYRRAQRRMPFVRRQVETLAKFGGHTRTCNACGDELPARTVHFRERPTGTDSLYAECRECMRDRQRVWRRSAAVVEPTAERVQPERVRVGA